jgi:hypothetical protein
MLPAFFTVAIVTPLTIIFLFEVGLGLAALAMILSGRREFRACLRIIVLATEFLAALPAPRLPTTSAYYKLIVSFKAARKNIVARSIFQTPSLAPGALLGIIRAWHLSKPKLSYL